jgi:hypothetical protein
MVTNIQLPQNAANIPTSGGPTNISIWALLHGVKLYILKMKNISYIHGQVK